MLVPRVQDACLPPPAAPSPTCEIVKKIALSCLKDLAVSLALATLVACFIPTQAGLTLLFQASLVQFAVSAFFHALGTFASVKKYERIAEICEWITGFNFAIFSGFNSQKLIHESGHALAALALYKSPRPQISIQPFVGGATQFYKTSLNPFGKKLGPVSATFIMVLCGPGLTLIVSSVLFAVGFALKEKHPQLGKYLIAWSILDFVDHANYAYSALHTETTNLMHDFVHLSIFGLDPLAATIGIVAIPIVISLGMHFCRCRQENWAGVVPAHYSL